MLTRLVLILIGILPATTMAAPAANAADPTITVFAAASMKNALDAVSAAFRERTGITVSTS